MYNTTCLKTTLDSQQSVLLGQNATSTDGRFEIDETAITECAIAAQNDGQVEEGIPYVAGNTLWAVYQVIYETLNSDSSMFIKLFSLWSLIVCIIIYFSSPL